MSLITHCLKPSDNADSDGNQLHFESYVTTCNKCFCFNWFKQDFFKLDADRNGSDLYFYATKLLFPDKTDRWNHFLCICVFIVEITLIFVVAIFIYIVQWTLWIATNVIHTRIPNAETCISIPRTKPLYFINHVSIEIQAEILHFVESSHTNVNKLHAIADFLL